VLGCIHRWLQPRPHLIADQFSLRDFAHPKLPSSFAQRVQIIREHCLALSVYSRRKFSSFPDWWNAEGMMLWIAAGFLILILAINSLQILLPFGE
ncbi:MAG: hypothetical protein P4L99_21380, partial [Chthoniobacter sp.]|nr:hypothetical protein [Chthoniobacter sp.]